MITMTAIQFICVENVRNYYIELKYDKLEQTTTTIRKESV